MKSAASSVTYGPGVHRPSGLFKRILDWILDRDDEALMEARRRRLWSAAGIRSLLNPEALEVMRNGEEPERSGGPAPERRR